MSSVLFLSIAATGLTVAFFHAALPTHWFPFVMTSRAQKWSLWQTLSITLLAGLGHVLATTVLGVLIVWLGVTLDAKIGQYFPWMAGGFLILFGSYYLIQQYRGQGHRHHHHHHGHDRGACDLEDQRPPKQTSDRLAIFSLVAMLTFSPCESFLPVYLSGVSAGWSGFLLLSGVLAAGTVTGMVVFTWLTLVGLEKVKFTVLEKYESLAMGLILCALGILIIVFDV